MEEIKVNEKEYISSPYGERDLSLDAYKKWHEEYFGEKLNEKLSNWFELIGNLAIKNEASIFSSKIKSNISSWASEYSIRNKGFDLLSAKSFDMVLKPFDSVINKIYRKNYSFFENSHNKKEKKPIKVINCFQELNDTVRTTIVVKYLDAVDYLAKCIFELGKSSGIDVKISKQARNEGYFAQHLYYVIPFKAYDLNFDEIVYEHKIEIQIVTQLQDVIRRLTHMQYEARRINLEKSSTETPWQWNYRDDDFFKNGLGHVIHYLEGMILEVRDKKCKEN